MLTFIIYELKVAATLITFYLCFKCFLSQEKMHRVNRIVILATSVLSFILPLCVITVHKTVYIPEATVFGISGDAVEVPTPIIESLGGVSWEPFIIATFWIGVVYVLGRTAFGIWRVARLVWNGERKEIHGSEVIACDKNIPPFSWMKWIVMSRDDFESGNIHILEHEKAHIRLGHSKDILLFDIMSAFQWFNPAVWLLKRELRAIHEYEADDAVLRQGADIKEYQYSLIRKAVSASGYSITNSFNHSILKNRITMMSKSNATAMRGLRVLYILPLVCGALALNARTVTNCKVTENSSVSDDSTVKVEIQKDGGGTIHYYANGESIAYKDIPEAVNSLIGSDKEAKVEIIAPAEISCGIIDDLREQLRSVPALKVQYSSPNLGSVPMRLPPANKTVEKIGVKLIELPDAVKNMPKEMVRHLKINKDGKYLYDTNLIMQSELLNMAAGSIRKNHQTMICLQTDRATSYGTYVTALKELSNAVSLIRNEYANEHFGKAFEDLDDAERSLVLKEIPQNIIELTPRTTQSVR